MGDNVIEALSGVSFDIHKSELLAIVGSSGSGKSTAMHILGLLDEVTSGKYLLEGDDVTHLTKDQQAELRNKYIGFVFQQFFLLPRLTAIKNIMLPLTYREDYSKSMEKQAKELLARVGMEKYSQHMPMEMSGGQQQRIAIARALITDPSLVLADEPTGALDSKTSQDVMNLLIDLNKNDGKTIVIVTHDPKVAEQCNRVIHLSDGKVIKD